MDKLTPEQLVKYLLPDHPNRDIMMERARAYSVKYVNDAIAGILTSPETSYEKWFPLPKTTIKENEEWAKQQLRPPKINFNSGRRPSLPPDHVWVKTERGFEARPTNRNTGVQPIQRRMQ